MSLADLVAEYVPSVDDEMRAVLDGRPEQMDLHRYLQYHLGWVDEEFRPLPEQLVRRYGGKRLRPILCLLAYRNHREDWHRALGGAAAVELIQNCTLIHDDVEDNDPSRRHRPTVWKLWGVPQAVNAGSCMQALVNSAVLRLAAQGVGDRLVLQSVRILTDCIVELTEGQYLDMQYEGRFDVTLDGYFAMTTRKTGALFEAAVWLGALLALDDPEVAQEWRTVGRAFGLAFQARDDILGIWEESESTGKNSGGDIFKRKKSLPVVYALTRGSAQDRDAILQAYSQESITPADVERVVKALDQCGAAEYCRQVVRQHGQQALASLARIPDGPTAAEVRCLVELVMAR